MNFNDLRLIKLKKENPKEERFWIMNIVIPLFFTAMLYLILNSTHLFESIVYGLFGPEAPLLFGRPLLSENVFRFVCLYGRDFCWGYALLFAVGWMFHGSRAQFRKGLGLILAFETVLELWKLFSISARGLSLGSLSAIFVGNLIAIIVVMVREEWLL